MRKQMDKKGVETLVAWVLLVGLSVTLAALVTNWAINNARQFNAEEVLDDEVYCNDVSININKSCYIRNNGMFSITQVKIQKNTGTVNYTLNPKLNPGESKMLTLTYGFNLNDDCALTGTSCSNSDCVTGHNYIPVIMDEDGKNIVCSVKKVGL